MKRCHTPIVFLLGVFLATFVLAPSSAAPARAQEDAAEKPALRISSVTVEPAKPAADTLCRLRIELENAGENIASQLGFSVKINGQELPVYKSHLFMFPVPPGGASELALYNFWSTETSRPMPPSGKLEVEVSLLEARWMDISTEGDTETWTPLGDVTNLPAKHSITIEMQKSATAGASE